MYGKQQRLPSKRAISFRFQKHLSIYILGIFGLLQVHLAKAQCTLATRLISEISVDATCTAVVTWQMLVTQSPGCSGDNRITVTLANNSVITGLNSVSIPSTVLDTRVNFVIENLASSNQAMLMNVLMVDKTAPSITSGTCPIITIGCNADTLPTNPAIGFPDFMDNCGLASLVYTDNRTVLNCAGANNIIRGISRRWTATDLYGNTATCIQTIQLTKSDPSSIVWPANRTLSCTAPDVSPTVTGFPMLDGSQIRNGGGCGFSVTYTDQTTSLGCQGNSRITRTWRLVSACYGTITHVQTIDQMDQTPPSITCPLSRMVSVGNNCLANVTLEPLLSATDNCSNLTAANIEHTLSLNGVIIGTGTQFNNLPIGDYDVSVKATDYCGNMSTCAYNLVVRDNIIPTLVTNDSLQFVLNNTGAGTFFPQSFDNGSFDNCGGGLLWTVSTDGINYTNTIDFTTADIANNPQVVIIRVCEQNNPASCNTVMGSVLVQDKTAPFLTGTPTFAVNCPFLLSDVASLPGITIDEPSAYTVDTQVTSQLTNCGVGTITRTFTVTDASNNVSTFVQTITVSNPTPFAGVGIVWPRDTTITTANCTLIAQLAPNALPTGYQSPILPTVDCAMLALGNPVDQVFYTSYPACYKILRKWEIIDWCQTSSSNPTIGRWFHTQEIKVMDVTPPVITAPADITVGLNSSCTFAQVSLPAATFTDCDPRVTITNNAPVATVSGANASGNYPVGVHQVEFTGRDKCNNVGRATMTITVRDLTKPTVMCTNGLNIELQTMLNPAGQSAVLAMVQASQLIDLSGTRDNCTAQGALRYFIRRATGQMSTTIPTTTGLTFDCSHIGLQAVEVWVVDAAGNADYCVTNIDVQDNMNLCTAQPPRTMTVSGTVQRKNGDLVKNVCVAVQGTSMVPDTTQDDGKYLVQPLRSGQTYTLAPFRNDNPQNGVTTLDILLISRHILSIEPILDPYLLIAGDVNGSGAVTMADIVSIRRLILGLISEFPNNVPSWRFIPKDYVFPNPQHPFSATFPESKVYAAIQDDWTGQDYVAVKVGDINLSARLDNVLSPIVNRVQSIKSVLIKNEFLTAGTIVQIPVEVNETSEFHGLSFHWKWSSQLSLLDVESKLPEFFTNQTTNHSLEVLSVHPQVYPLTGNTLMTLSFEVLTSGWLKDQLTFGESTEWLDANMNVHAAQIEWLEEKPAIKEGLVLHQNYPNPFSSTTLVGVDLSEEETPTLTVYDISGKKLLVKHGQMRKGYQSFTIHQEELPSAGIYWYEVQSASYRSTKKMMRL